MSTEKPPRQVIFESPPEIFATDNGGRFRFVLSAEGSGNILTGEYDEVRFVFSLWHPSAQRKIDLDRAYVELCGSLDPHEEHWIKLAEIEPVVPPYAPGGTFDGWIVLPVLAATTAFSLAGTGFEARARLQVRASAFFVA